MPSNDAQDILGGGSQTNKRNLPTMKLTNVDKKKVITSGKPKRPVGMHRELYNLFVHQGKDDNKEKIESLMPTSTKRGFSLAKAKLGKRPVRKWILCPFVHEARTDGLSLRHWEREDKHSVPYSFVRFNKQLNAPSFTEEEYEQHLQDTRWTREQTEHLLDLCKQFDLRWPIIEDRFDQEKCKNRKSMEDMKERYYGFVNTLNELRDVQADPLGYDAEHERRRKEQLEKQWNRTEEQIKEEEELMELVKRIDTKRKDRERKAYDLQKLINQTDRVSISPDSCSTPSASTTVLGPGRGHHRRSMKKIGTSSFMDHLLAMDSHIRWSEFKTPGPHLRSQEMKLPSNIGQKKLSNIGLVVTNQKIVSIGLEYPHAFEEIVKLYNDFRSHIVLLQDLKTALHNTEMELDQLTAQMPPEKMAELSVEPRFRVSNTFYEELERNPVKVLNSPMTEGGKGKGKGSKLKPAPVTGRAITKLIEVNTAPPTTITRKRRFHYPSMEGTPPTRSQTAASQQQQQQQQQ